MATVGAFEAKNHLAELLERARNGERITITKRGVPAAMLVPIESRESIRPAEAVARLKELRRTLRPMDRTTIRDLIDEGRRY
jgi:prevent-host-death family protein